MDPTVAAQIHALQQAAYAVEARRIGCSDFPPLRETWEELRQSTDFFLIFCKGDLIVGALSCESARQEATINRLIVSPEHFRQGVAAALLQAFEAGFSAGTRLRAATAAANEPGIKAYEKQGYRRVCAKPTPEGISLAQLQKILN